MFNEDTEKTLLYFIVFQNYKCDITEDDFVEIKNKKIINIINQLKKDNKEINFTLIMDLIPENEKTEYRKYLVEISDLIFNQSPDSIYNEIVKLTEKRKLYNLISKLKTELLQNGTNKDEIISEIQNIEDRTIKSQTFKQQVIEAVKDLENKYNKRDDHSLYTEIISLDKILLGLHNGELTIIGARPGVGKTTLALQIAETIARKNKKIVFISLEMSNNQIIQKMISNNTGINNHIFRAGTIEDKKQWDDIATASSELMELNINLTDNIYTIEQISSMARELKYKNELDVLFIDYLQLVKAKGNYQSREREVADITRTLKLLSLELDIPIIALCQLNRNADGKIPTLADLRESGSIEQDADNVLFLYPNENIQTVENIVATDLKIAKQRAGETGTITLTFDKRSNTFYATVE